MSELLSLLQGTPLFVVLTIGTVAGLFFIWRHSEKLDLDSIKEIGELQSKQIMDLQSLVSALTEQLSEARREIGEISKQNQELRLHVMKLEAILLANGLTPPQSSFTVD